MRPSLLYYDAPAELRDGSRVHMRQARRADRDLLVRGF